MTQEEIYYLMDNLSASPSIIGLAGTTGLVCRQTWACMMPLSPMNRDRHVARACLDFIYAIDDSLENTSPI